mmetsp:Transcript_17857/g.42732  ORF Transcript_17857/g.42732 Transcript_17857/m.42732 type:complete len:237 (+) Transcript_17857:328-1038(+)
MSTLSPTTASQPWKLSRLRGNPSIRNSGALACAWEEPCAIWPSISCCSSLHVISTGTILPCLMQSSMRGASAEEGSSRALRRSSPAERCEATKLDSSSSLCVPFPLPGPPRMNTTSGFAAAFSLLADAPEGSAGRGSAADKAARALGRCSLTITLSNRPSWEAISISALALRRRWSTAASLSVPRSRSRASSVSLLGGAMNTYCPCTPASRSACAPRTSTSSSGTAPVTATASSAL